MTIHMASVVKCYLRYLFMLKASILSMPKTGSMVASGVENCQFFGSWRLCSFTWAFELITH